MKPALAQLPPEFVDLITPTRVPAYTTDEVVGSTAKLIASVRPRLMGNQLAPASVDLRTTPGEVAA
jgi:hypothetical protein